MGGGASAASKERYETWQAADAKEKDVCANDRNLLMQRLEFTDEAEAADAEGFTKLAEKLKNQRADLIVQLRRKCFGKDERQSKQTMITLLTEQIYTAGMPDAWKDEYKFMLNSEGGYKATCGGLEIPLGLTFPRRQMLVVTPLTRECRKRIFEAWNGEKILCFKGPPGTGKVEAIVDTYRDLGIHPILVNCPKTEDEIKNVVEQWKGCPLIFDEVTKLDAEVLAKLPEICAGQHVCVTFAPGQEGEPDLSEAQLEKCVVQDMTVPDFKLILEVMLYGEGFLQGDKLGAAIIDAGKVTGLRELKKAVDELAGKAAADWVAVGQDEVAWATGKCEAL